MSELIKAPRMFTVNEWMCSNKTKYGITNLTRESSQNLDQECDRAMDEIEKRSEKTMQDVDEKIGQRLNDTEYWRGELDNKLADNAKESERLYDCIVRLKKALAATNEPLHIANQCINTRNERNGIDLVADMPHKELIGEVETIKGVQSLLTRTIEQANEQLRLNRKACFNLKKDYIGKQSAHDIDEYAKTISTYGESIPSIFREKIEFTPSFSPIEWQSQTQNNLEMADQQLKNSSQMRNLLEGILIQVYDDQTNQINKTNWSLKNRIKETRDAKGKLEEHLALVLKEISDMEDNIDELNIAINALKKPVAITESRQNLRDIRPGVELCRDTAHYRIIEQNTELRQDAHTLCDRLHRAQDALKALCRRQLDLEEEIINKTHTLHIDEVEVLGMRDSVLIQKY